MDKILIPTPLRQYADKQDSVELAGATVGEALKSLTSKYADLRRHLAELLGGERVERGPLGEEPRDLAQAGVQLTLR